MTCSLNVSDPPLISRSANGKKATNRLGNPEVFSFGKEDIEVRRTFCRFLLRISHVFWLEMLISLFIRGSQQTLPLIYALPILYYACIYIICDKKKSKVSTASLVNSLLRVQKKIITKSPAPLNSSIYF